MGKPSIPSFQLSATIQKRSCTMQCNQKTQGVSEPVQKGLIVKTDEHRHNSSAGRQIIPARTGCPEATRDCPSHHLAAAQNQL